MNKRFLLTLFAVCMMSNSALRAMDTLNNKGVKVALGIGAAVILQGIARTEFGEACCRKIGFSPKATAATLGFSLTALTSSIFANEYWSNKLVYAAYAAPFAGILNNILNKNCVREFIGDNPLTRKSLITPKPTMCNKGCENHYKDYGAISAITLVLCWEFAKEITPKAYQLLQSKLS
jgi:hypothetical protein